MTQKATFQWREMYLHFVRAADPSVTDPNLSTIRIKRPYGMLTISEKAGLDLRETGGKREVVKAIFKSAHGFVVLTTAEGHVIGTIYYFPES